ncbi:hypothetical protein HAX54_033481, partial [Datura stramonium]|nr:hypothetical protein [Datura stramonium]
MKDDVTFPHDEYEVVNDTPKRKSGSYVQRTSTGKSKGCSATNSYTNELAQKTGRGKGLTSLGSVRGSLDNETLIIKSKGLNPTTYYQNAVSKKTNLVPLSFDPMEDFVTFPHEEYEVLNDTLKIKS